MLVGICAGGKVETQNLASHKEVSAMCMNNNVPTVVCSHCTGDAIFCVSTGWRGVVMRGGRDGVICHTVYNNKFMVFIHKFIGIKQSSYIEHFIPNAGIRNGTFGGYYLFF